MNANHFLCPSSSKGNPTWSLVWTDALAVPRGSQGAEACHEPEWSESLVLYVVSLEKVQKPKSNTCVLISMCCFGTTIELKNLKSITSCLSYKRQSKDEWHKSVVMRESTDNLLCLQYYSSFQIHYLFNICNHPTHRYFLISGVLWPPLSLPVNLSKVSYLVSRGEWMRTQAWCQPKLPLTKLTEVELRGGADSNNPVTVKEISSKSDHPAARGNDNCHVFNLDTYFSRRKPVMLTGNRVVCLRSRFQMMQ